MISPLPDLFGETRLPPESEEERRRREWAEFHEANPAVYRCLREYAVQARSAGVKRIGIRLLWERLRWDSMMRVARGGSPWKLNDHHPPFYARLLMAREPDLEGLFETRERRR